MTLYVWSQWWSKRVVIPAVIGVWDCVLSTRKSTSRALIKLCVNIPVISPAIASFVSIVWTCVTITMKCLYIPRCIGWRSTEDVSSLRIPLLLSTPECSIMSWCPKCIILVSWGIGLPTFCVGWFVQHFYFGLLSIFGMRLAFIWLLFFLGMWLLFIFGMRYLFMWLFFLIGLRLLLLWLLFIFFDMWLLFIIGRWGLTNISKTCLGEWWSLAIENVFQDLWTS